MKKLPVTMAEQEFIDGIKKVKRSKVKLAFMLGFYQCMRVSEIVALRKQHIDYSRGYIHILNAKFGKDRDVPIMKPVKSGLKHLPVNISIRQLQRLVKKYWPKIHFHILRHSGATCYHNDKGVDITFIQQLLGHSRLDTTMIYTHISPKQLSNVFEKVWE